MSFGKAPKQRRERLGLLGTLLFLLWVSPHVVGAPNGGLGELMARLAKVRTLYARYSEEVRASLLQHSITSTGAIGYAAPDTIVKSTDGTPSQEVRIEGDRLSIREGGEIREIPIGEHRAIEAMVSSLRSLFAGDLVDLERHFRVGFERLGSKEHSDGWRLTLDPREAAVSWLLLGIEIQGIGREVRRIELLEPNGDSRMMRFDRPVIDPPDE